MTVARGPVVIRRRLGFLLKQLRTQRRLHLDTVARRLEISPSKLSRLETGQVEPKLRDVRDLLDVYEAAPETRDQIMEWATDAKQPGWWQPFAVDVAADLDLYISLEAEARSVQMYSTPVSGLLQTEEYARTVLQGVVPNASPTELDELVRVRIGRQIVVDTQREDQPPLELHAVLDEAALHRGPSSGAVMLNQLQELLNRSEQPNITLQVLPFDVGYASATSTFAIFEPRRPDDWTVVNVESTGADAYYDTPAEIARYRSIWHDVQSRALDPDNTRNLIQTLLSRN